MASIQTGLQRPGSSDSPFHIGELAIQTRAGTLAQSAITGRRGIRDHMPDQHREFFAQLPFMLVGSVDVNGQPWASVLVGQPGFMHSPDPKTLRIDAHALPGDVLGSNVRHGARLGLLGLEPTTRRRNRLNAAVTNVDAAGFTLGVTQSFGNCPQYIQGRQARFVEELGPLQVLDQPRLLDADRALIEAADTLFIASNAMLDPASPTSGADVSHRGGRPGFVRVEGGDTLVFPDFTGNSFYQTLGNLHLDPRAGILFIDFISGDLLQLCCSASVVWEGPELEAFVGAERLVRLKVERVRRLVNSMPLRWSNPSYWPLLERTGTWALADAALAAERLAANWRPYRIAEVIDESAGIRSFLLEPADGHGVPHYVPGQFLPVALPTETGILRRTYTLSAAPSGRQLRMSVKRQGAASSWLHEHGAGAVIDALGPRGSFTFDRMRTRPAVMLSAGVGITPMIAMLDGLLVNNERSRFPYPIHFIHGARSENEQAFAAFLATKQRHHKNLSVHLVHSQPEGGLPPDNLKRHVGRVTIGMLKTLLPFDDYDFYLCGPQGFLQHLYDGLRALHVPDAQIHLEDFGGDQPLRRQPDADAPLAQIELVDAADAVPVPVLFHRSGRSVTWRPEAGTLLELAESEGLAPLSGCRSGNCGTCATTLLAGRTGYLTTSGAPCPPGQILPCISVPLASIDGGAVVLDG
ncbi:pyridoxamine 5'-phosphate oxidase family protein [Telluria aromaticivorans]|uniref:2Fe-2S iron-sulfur cluster binding domain-containing protein n=1 Tax=Telluria aromaticivorans TaxID=2725995 RepID=A0A7Y2JXL7_9BURK|nr:pyridoxamine 5'-phosphate oxidase family protein [Telluria aromaticivorans]NNG21619.1 2Fe-2S iron-sulfur cluster binding domain-containing protein [Telluria aromaticivorans]